MQHATSSRTGSRIARAARTIACGALASLLLAPVVTLALAPQDATRPRQSATSSNASGAPNAQKRDARSQAAQTSTTQTSTQQSAPTGKTAAPPPPPPPPRLQQQQQPAASGNTPELRKSQDAATEASEEVDPGDVIDINTSLINLQVRVIDRQGRPVNDVRKEDVRVFEDNVPQQVEFFSTEEVPISYGLAIDTSRSLKDQIGQVIEASKAIVGTNKPGDETVLFQFRNDTELILDFTADKKAVTDKLDELYVSAGQTAVIDAVYLSAEYVAQRKARSEADLRRRALILVTDGEERGSQYEQKQLFDFLREQGVQIYVIGFVKDLDAEGSLIKKSPRKKAEELIKRIAAETGGRAFFPESVSELPKIAEDITRDLRTQYVVGYQPTNKARDNRFRAVRVQIADAPGREKRIALTRSGYTPGAGGATPANGKRNE